MKMLPNLLIIFLLVPSCNFAQEKDIDELDSVAATLIKNIRSHSKEDILIHTDKQVYIAGETIWFKTFIVDTLNGRLSNKSKILFVDVVDHKNTVITRLFLNAGRFHTDGAIVLNDSNRQGTYWLRAYTRQTINQLTSNIALQPIYLINAKNKDTSGELTVTKTQEVASTVKTFIEIYPEGGSLISGTNTTVAIKLYNQDGVPMIVKGLVKDSRGQEVSKFSTNKAGLAKFNFFLRRNAIYSIYIEKNDGHDSVAILPKVNLYAAQLSVTEQNDRFIKVRVMLEDSIVSPNYTTYLLGISKDSLCFAGVGKGIYELDIPVSNFPGGVANLLLVNTKKEVVSERSIYIHKKALAVNLTTDKQNYAAREPVKLDIEIKDANGKPMPAALSVSVIDSRFGDTINYFTTRDSLADHSSQDTDLLMLVKKGIKKNTFASDLTNLSSALNKPEDPFALQGIVVNAEKLPVRDQEVVLMSGESNPFFIQDTTDLNGRFSFHLPDHDDSTKFSFQVNNLKGVKQAYDIILDEGKFPDFKGSGANQKRINLNQGLPVDKIEQYYIDLNIPGAEKQLLAPVTLKTSVKSNSSSNTITQEMLKKGGFNNAGEAVLKSGKLHLVGGYLMAGGPNRFGPSPTDEPNVIVDGVQMPLPEGSPIENSPVMAYLKTISADDISSIKVLTGVEGGGYGVRGGHGVIEIRTNTNAASPVSTSNLKAIYPKGFHVPPVFEMPDYKNKKVKAIKYPDLRTTIFWNGDIITDNNGKTSVEFFTADSPATYIVTITGVTSRGDTIYKTASIDRK